MGTQDSEDLRVRVSELETELRDFAYQYIQCGCNHPHCSRCGDYRYILEKVLKNEAPHEPVKPPMEIKYYVVKCTNGPIGRQTTIGEFEQAADAIEVHKKNKDTDFTWYQILVEYCGK